MEQFQRFRCFQPFCCPAHPGLEGVLETVLIFLCIAILNCLSLNFVLAQAFWHSPNTAVVQISPLKHSYWLLVRLTGVLLKDLSALTSWRNFSRASVCSILHLLSFSFCCQGTCVRSDSGSVQQSNFNALKTTPSSIKFEITDPAKLMWQEILFVSEYHWGLYVKGTKGVILIQPDTDQDFLWHQRP